MTEEDQAQKELIALVEEHQKLDEHIMSLTKGGPFDQLMVQRLKKRKLILKDQISKLRSFLCDDIIA